MEDQGLEGPMARQQLSQTGPSCVQLSRCGSEGFCLASLSCVAQEHPSFS